MRKATLALTALFVQSLVGYCCATVADLPKWLNWTCPENPRNLSCSCQAVNGIECFVGANRTDGKTIECSKAESGPSSVSISCHSYQECLQVNVYKILDSFANLKTLHIHNCSLDTAQLIIGNHLWPNFSWSSSVTWKNRVGGRILINTTVETDLKTEYLPPCFLNNLNITRSRLYGIPVILLDRCKYLYSVNLSENDITVVEMIDFVVISRLTYLNHLIMNGNGMNMFGTLFTDYALKSVCYQLFSGGLVDWVRGNSVHFANDTYHNLLDFAGEFAGCANHSAPPRISRVIAMLEKYDVPIDFAYGSFRPTTLELENNTLRYVPDVIMGFSGLKVLRLDGNKMSDTFDLDNFKIFYGVSRGLQILSMSQNDMTSVSDKSFQYLNRLAVLDLSWNRINYFSPTAALENNNFQLIDLSHNELSFCIIGTQMNQLWKIDLSFNKLKSLDSSITNNIPVVEQLILSHNNISSFGPLAIANLSKLWRLDLRANTFHSLPEQSFRTRIAPSKSQRVILNIRGNHQRLLCGCNSVFAAVQKELVKYQNTTYAYPEIDIEEGSTCSVFDSDSAPVRKALSKSTFFCYTTPYEIGCLTDCPCCENMNKPCPCRWYCPVGCLCYEKSQKNYRVFSCTNMTYIPTVSVYLTIFKLENNRIPNIGITAFSSNNLTTLQSLHLNHSGIRWIARHAFAKLKGLYYLNLAYNRISYIAEGVFYGLDKIQTLLIYDNQIKTPSIDPFQSISHHVSHVNLESNPFECDCEALPLFLSKVYELSTSGLSFFMLPNTCHASRQFAAQTKTDSKELSLSELENLCNTLAVERMRRLLWGVGFGVGLCLLVILLVVVFHYKYALLVYADRHLRSHFARASLGRLLHLPSYHQRPFDVGFLVHERQSQHYYEMRRQIRSTPRQALRTFRIAQYMPGAMRLSQTEALMSEMAMCVALISSDLLDDPLFVQELHLVLSTNLRRRGELLDVLPILLDAKVRDHAEWANFRLLLNGYPTLVWRSHFFWERFITALPPPPPPRPSQDALCEESEPLLGSASHESEGAQLCVISHENQVGSHVRQVLDRFRAHMRICHVRHGRLFGTVDGLVSAETLSLDAVIGCCTQVIVLVSLELLDDQWTRAQVVPSLMARSTIFAFRDSIILLDIGVGFSQLCSRPAYRFFAELRDHETVLIRRWVDVQRNWDVLDRHLLTEETDGFEPGHGVTSMDEAEYERLLMQPTAMLRRDDEETEEEAPGSYRIFEQNMARLERNAWPGADDV